MNSNCIRGRDVLRAVVVSSLVGGAAAAPQGFELTPLILEGLAAGGVGTVTRVDSVAINNHQQWIVEVDTDNPNTDADGAFVFETGAVLQHGTALAAPVGATISSFGAPNLNASGDFAINMFLDGTSGGNDDSGVFLNTSLLIQEGTVSTAPGLSPGTPYIGFFTTKINDAGQVLLMASIDDPAVASTVDRALVRLDLDGTGAIVSEVALAFEGVVLEAGVPPVQDFETNPHTFDFNDNGDVMFVVEFDTTSASDQAIYVNGTRVATEGEASPVPGRNWSSLASSRVSFNNNLEYAFSGSLEGDSQSNLLIVNNGNKLVQEGDSLPAIAPFAFTTFGSGPVHIADSGDVLWYGDWNDPDTDVDTGLFLNDQLIVQEGVTTVAGVAIDTLRGVQEGYSISDDGRFIVFRGVLEDGRDFAAMLSPSGSVTEMSDCFANAGSLALIGGSAGGGDVLNFELGAGQSSGALGFLFGSIAPVPGWPACGVQVPGLGEILISVSAPNPVVDLFAGAWTGVPLPVDVGVPTALPLVGVAIYLQGALVDGANAAEPVRLTGGYEVVIGDA